jgi:16S rRNA (cytidine1402-2'-O)-methyltransferase
MLYIIATPIGNLEDITLRALKILKEIDFILCEDTRKTALLLKRFGIKKKLFSFYEHNEIKRIPWVINQLKKGKKIALVSNAGTPTVSDPGYKLVRECKKYNLPITSLPGASSLVCALSLSAIPHDKFIFLGYLPRKKGERKKILEKVKPYEINLVFFETPHRLLDSLKDSKEIFGKKRITICRELTKKFEQVLETDLEEAIKYFEENKARGEFTLVLENQ